MLFGSFVFFCLVVCVFRVLVERVGVFFLFSVVLRLCVVFLIVVVLCLFFMCVCFWFVVGFGCCGFVGVGFFLIVVSRC